MPLVCTPRMNINYKRFSEPVWLNDIQTMLFSSTNIIAFQGDRVLKDVLRFVLSCIATWHFIKGLLEFANGLQTQKKLSLRRCLTATGAHQDRVNLQQASSQIDVYHCMTVVYFFILVWQLELPREQIIAVGKNQSQANIGLLIEVLTKAD